MKLVDLDAAGTRQRYDNYLSVGFPDDVFEQLRPYRENREAAGFVRLAVGVLLVLINGDIDSIKYVADELTCACGDVAAIDTLQARCHVLGGELGERLTVIERERWGERNNE